MWREKAVVDKKIYHFYHIWADGAWHLPVEEHILSLRHGGLIDNIYKFYIGIVGSKENRNSVKEYLNKQDIVFKICTEKDFGFEQETLEKIPELEDDDGYILYAHTKGSYNNKIYEHESRKKLNKNLIENWRLCVDKLQDNAAVGLQYTVVNYYNMVQISIYYPPGKIFARYGEFDGNFWWSHVKYLKALGKPFKIKTSDGLYIRQHAETWIRNLCNVVFAAKEGDALLPSDFDENNRFSVFSVDTTANIIGAETENVEYESLKDLIQDLLEKEYINYSSRVSLIIKEEDLYAEPLSFVVQGLTKKEVDGVLFGKQNYKRSSFKKRVIFKDRTVLFELANMI